MRTLTSTPCSVPSVVLDSSFWTYYTDAQRQYSNADDKVSTEVKTFADLPRGNPVIFKVAHFYYSQRRRRHRHPVAYTYVVCVRVSFG